MLAGKTLQGGAIVIQKARDSPLASAVGGLGQPMGNLAAEAASTDDVEGGHRSKD